MIEDPTPIVPLPHRITGFANVGRARGYDPVADIRALCFPFVPAGSRHAPHGSASYHRFPIRHAKTQARVDLLAHDTLRWWAAITPESEWMELVFVPVAREIAEQLSPRGIRFLAPAELDAPLRAEDCVNLGPHEMQQVRYWNSATVGSVIFNGYD